MRLLYLVCMAVSCFMLLSNRSAQAQSVSFDFDATRRLESALAEREKGSEVSLDQIVTLLEESRREYRVMRGPGDEEGVGSWRVRIRQLTREYPQTVRELAAKASPFSHELMFALGDTGGDKNIEFLVGFLRQKLEFLKTEKARGTKEDPDWLVSHAVVLALGRTKSKTAWGALEEALNCDFSHVSCNAMGVLAEAGDEAIIPAVKEWLSSEDNGKRQTALSAVVSLSSGDLKPKLAQELSDPLTKMLSDPKNEQEMIVEALASLGDESVLPLLHEIALDESDYLKEIERMKNWPDPWRGRHPPCNWKQNEALDAIAKLGSLKSVAILDKLAVEAKDENIRRRANQIVEEIRKLHNVDKK